MKYYLYRNEFIVNLSFRQVCGNKFFKIETISLVKIFAIPIVHNIAFDAVSFEVVW